MTDYGPQLRLLTDELRKLRRRVDDLYPAERPILDYGTYTPALTAVTNVAASTAYSAQYIRVGNTVTVSGQVDIDPTATGSTKLGISLPVASNFDNPNELGGVASSIAVAQAAGIYADAANDRASLEYIAASNANAALLFTFTYRVI